MAGAGCIIVPSLAAAVGSVALAGAGLATVYGATAVACRGIDGAVCCAGLIAGGTPVRDNRTGPYGEIQGPEQDRQRRYIKDNGRGPPRAIQGPGQR